MMVTAEYLFAFVETPINKQFVGWSFKKAQIHN